MANTAMPNVVARGPAQSQTSALDVQKSVHQHAARKGANWFYLIAGLSVVNTFIVMGGSNTHFVVGLGVTELFDVVGKNLTGPGQSVALVFSLTIAAIFALFGYFANKMQQWSFVLGMMLYALDGALLLYFSDYLSAGFHAFVLFYVFRGFSAARNFAGLKPANAPLG